jgi:hypothetical protein
MTDTKRWMTDMLDKGPTGWCCPHQPRNAQGYIDFTKPGPPTTFDALTKSLYCNRLDCLSHGRTMLVNGKATPVLVPPKAWDAIEEFTCDHCREYSGTVTDVWANMGRLTFKAGLCRACKADLTAALARQS